MLTLTHRIANLSVGVLLVALLLAPILWSPTQALAAKPAWELSFSSRFDTAPGELTTEQVWDLEPDERNPHRKEWVLERRVSLDGLSAQADPKTGKYQMHASGLSSVSLLHLRAQSSPYYFKLEQFPCTRTPLAGYATRRGSAYAGQVADKLWNQELGRKRIALAVALSHVQTDNAPAGLMIARRIFNVWLGQAEDDFDAKILPEARKQEWQRYLKLAKGAKLCRKGIHKLDPGATAWNWPVLLASSSDQPSEKLVARAPARRWSGRYTVRLAVDIGGEELNGQFLLDTSASESTVSPTWLKNQGVNPKLIQAPTAHPERISWSGGHGVGTRVLVDQVRLAGRPLPFRSFLTLETSDVFGPPQYFGTCCDGVLGADFMSSFAVELSPGPPSEIRLYDRDGFDLGGKTAWTELHQTDADALVSDACVLRGKGHLQRNHAFWDTGSTQAFRAASWPAKSRQAKLSCGAIKQSSSFPVSTGKLAAILAPRDAAFSIGQAWLDLGDITFDLPHGKVWLSDELVHAKPRRNRSGLHLEVVTGKDPTARSVVVRREDPGTQAAKLRHQGLMPGMKIRKIDDVNADELDDWEIERHLSGVYGPTVKLEWRQGKVDKLAPLKVR